MDPGPILGTMGATQEHILGGTAGSVKASYTHTHLQSHLEEIYWTIYLENNLEELDILLSHSIKGLFSYF